jgi:sugar/nucleoside kinase (ribokinase family)
MKVDSRLILLAAGLRQQGPRLALFPVVAGFDGFVDEMISVVYERSSLTTWTAVNDITAFADLIKAAAGRSSLREIVVHRADPGGCAVNMGDGLIALGVPLHCFATLGQPRHAAFEAFARRCRSCHSWGREPGRTLAFEFADGKLMFSSVTPLAEFDPAMLKETLQDGAYLDACRQARLIALTDWTLYPHMTACWQKLQADIYSKLLHKPYFFIDLVDPSSRSTADVQAMVRVLPGFERTGPTVLGLNGTEANVLSRILGIPKAGDDLSAVEQQAQSLRESLEITCVVIHCLKFAVCADSQKTARVLGPFCSSPKKSTGAGDRFNAGFCSGLLLGFDQEASLLLGSAASGFFVRETRSATADELVSFIESWAKGHLEGSATG